MEETYPKSFIVYLRLVDYLSGSRGVYCRRGVCSKNLGYVLLFFVCGNNLSSMGGEMNAFIKGFLNTFTLESFGFMAGVLVSMVIFLAIIVIIVFIASILYEKEKKK